MFDQHLGLFGAKLPTATGTVETNLAVEMYFTPLNMQTTRIEMGNSKAYLRFIYGL